MLPTLLVSAEHVQEITSTARGHRVYTHELGFVARYGLTFDFALLGTDFSY